MYEIKSKFINGVTTYTREILGFSNCSVESGTNGLHGGGAGHGGKAFVSIRMPNGSVKFVANDDGTGVDIEVYGDDEILSLYKSLSFAKKALEDGIEENSTCLAYLANIKNPRSKWKE